MGGTAMFWFISTTSIVTSGPRSLRRGFEACPGLLYSCRFSTSSMWSSGCWNAICKLEYPREKLDIQLLDDSTDETVEVARGLVERYAALGNPIILSPPHEPRGLQSRGAGGGHEDGEGRVHRHFRRGLYAAGRFPAAHGSSLHRAQGRDGANALDAHQPQLFFSDAKSRPFCSTATSCWSIRDARARGLFLILTARQECGGGKAIEEAGGWQHDTLTEDTDLSYRAQLKGWKFIYLQDVECPAELPVEMTAFKTQQARWAKGLIQTGIKILPKVMRSDAPLHTKIEAWYHLTANISYPLMVIFRCCCCRR